MLRGQEGTRAEHTHFVCATGAQCACRLAEQGGKYSGKGSGLSRFGSGASGRIATPKVVERIWKASARIAHPSVGNPDRPGTSGGASQAPRA